MELPNANWQQTLDQVAASPQSLESIELQNTLHNLLQSNVSVCQSMGGFFMPQMVRLFAPMLEVYTRLSQLINSGIQRAGPLGAQHSTIKAMRSVKKTALKLVETFVDTAEMEDHLSVIRADFVPALMTPILSDYKQSLPDAKCATKRPLDKVPAHVRWNYFKSLKCISVPHHSSRHSQQLLLALTKS